MNDATIAALIHRFRSAAQCAAALGISRQAFRAAMQRGQLSNAVALRAAAILAQNPTAPILDAAPDLPKQLYITTRRNNNYALNESIKNGLRR